MSAIEWRKQLAVGHPTIDQDHKDLIEYLNELDIALNAENFVPAHIAKVIIKLLEYTRQHFQREERIMEKVHFTMIESHKKQHVEAVKAISDMAKFFAKEPTRANAKRVYVFIADWLVDHIIMEDMQIAPFLRGVWL